MYFSVVKNSVSFTLLSPKYVYSYTFGVKCHYIGIRIRSRYRFMEGCYDPHPIETHGYAYPCPCNKIGISDNTIDPAECGAVSGDFGKALFELVLSLINHGSDI